MLMSPFRYLAASFVIMAAGLAAAPAEAAFHLWYIKEVYSNHDGTVQFIELFTSSANQDETTGEQIITGSGGVFTFPGKVTNPTNGHHVLLATSTFDPLPGSPTPNFITAPLPANFFDPDGDTITFVGADSKTFAFNADAIDGFNSRNWPSFGNAGMTIAANTPTNYSWPTNPAGTGQINLPPPPPDTTGDYNADGIVDAADYVYWRKTLGESVSPDGSGADGSGDGEINEADYEYWVQRFGEVPELGAGSFAIPEPSTIILSFVAWASLSIARRRL
jgi:hypothetical protein